MDSKQHQRYNIALSRMGERPEQHDWVAGEVRVERHGMTKPYFLFHQNDKVLARMDWKHGRGGTYESNDGRIRLDLSVSRMGTLLTAKDLLSRISRLLVKRTCTARRAKMIVLLSNSDRFFVQQRINSAHPERMSLHVTKEHYLSELFDVQFVDAFRKGGRRCEASRTVATVWINPVMRWEASQFHHLLALMVGRIVFVGEHDHFRFDAKRNRYFQAQGVNTFRHGRPIRRRPPKR